MLGCLGGETKLCLASKRGFRLAKSSPPSREELEGRRVMDGLFAVGFEGAGWERRGEGCGFSVVWVV